MVRSIGVSYDGQSLLIPFLQKFDTRISMSQLGGVDLKPNI